MARSNFVIFVTNPDGTASTSSTVTVTGRSPATPVAIYQDSSGTATVATPLLTDGSGKAQFWADDPQAYNVTISGTGITTFTNYWEAISAQTIQSLAGQYGALLAAASTPIVFESGTPIYGYAFLGDVGPAQEPGIALGGDTKLYRSAANTLYTPGNLTVIGTLTAGSIGASALPSNVEYIDRNQTISGVNKFTTPVWFQDSTTQNTAFKLYATPVQNVPVQFANQAGYATPIGILQSLLPSSLYATPVQNVPMQYANQAGFATPVQNVPMQFANQAGYATPIGIIQSMLPRERIATPLTAIAPSNIPSTNQPYGPAIQALGLIAATPGVVFGAAGTYDTNLYRSTTSTLKTDGALVVAASGNSALSLSSGGIDLAGNMRLTGATSQMLIQSQSTSNAGWLVTRISTDTSNRFVLRVDGTQEWGPGNAATDLNLYRSTTATLKTDNNLVVAGITSALGLITATPGIRFALDGLTQTTSFQLYATPVQNVPVQFANTAGYATPVQNVPVQFANTAGYATPLGQVFTGAQQYATPTPALYWKSAVPGTYTDTFVGIGTSTPAGSLDVSGQSYQRNTTFESAPIGQTSVALTGVMTATPGIRFSDGVTQIAGYDTTKVGLLASNQTWTGLNTYSTPVYFNSYIQATPVLQGSVLASATPAGPAIQAAGLITATPGFQFADGTIARTAGINSQQGISGILNLPFEGDYPSSTTLTAGNTVFSRFVPWRDIRVSSLSFNVQVLASYNDKVELGLYDSTGTRKLATTGQQAGLVNSTTGLKTVNLTTPITLSAATPYYAALAYATPAGATLPQVWCWVCQEGFLQWFGTSLPNVYSGLCTTNNALGTLPTTLSWQSMNNVPTIIALQ